jgi:hypothetical protein
MDKYNNYTYRVSGSGLSEIDAIWLKMPLENHEHVGLRPILVAVDADKWTLLDHLDELDAMGLSWMAA